MGQLLFALGGFAAFVFLVSTYIILMCIAAGVCSHEETPRYLRWMWR